MSTCFKIVGSRNQKGLPGCACPLGCAGGEEQMRLLQPQRLCHIYVPMGCLNKVTLIREDYKHALTQSNEVQDFLLHIFNLAQLLRGSCASTSIWSLILGQVDFFLPRWSYISIHVSFDPATLFATF